jgi:CheY-like chemotaxis protein
MKVLLAEDDLQTASLYEQILTERGHVVILTSNSEECLETYSESLRQVRTGSDHCLGVQPFDAVILDYKMPDISGLEVAKEILAINPRQRIIFASEYIKEALLESIRKLKTPVAILQKPISSTVLIDTLEDAGVYEELKKFKFDVEVFKKAGWSHELLQKIVDILEENTRQD